MRHTIALLLFAACNVTHSDQPPEPTPLVCYTSILQIDATGVCQDGFCFCSAMVQLDYDCGDATAGTMTIGWTDASGHHGEDIGPYGCTETTITNNVEIPCDILKAEGPKAFTAAATMLTNNTNQPVTCETN